MVAVARPPRRILRSNGQWVGVGDPVSAGATLRVTRMSATSRGVVAPPTDDFTLEVTKPSVSTTGWDRVTPLTVINGDVTLTAGQVMQNVDIRGFVRGWGAGAVLRNSVVRGRGAASLFVQSALVKGGTTGAPMLLDRVTLKPDVPRYYLNGVDGSNVVVNRCNIAGVVDGWHATGNDFKVRGNYVHDYAFFDGSTGSDHAGDAEFPGWVHADGGQHMGGSGLESIGNYYEMYIDPAVSVGVDAPLASGPYVGQTVRQLFTSPVSGRIGYGNALTFSPKAVGPVAGFLIRSDWFEGGRVHLQIPAQASGFDSGNSGEISNTRHGMDLNPYGAGKRYEIMRASAGMGTYTTTQAPVFDNVPSVTGWTAVTTTAKPVAGQPLPGTLNPLSFTVRKA